MSKNIGSEPLGRFYTGKKPKRRREWRGLKDTWYDYVRWLGYWKTLITFIIKPNNMKGFFRYRWMINYLALPDFMDRHTEGMRGTQLRMAHQALGLIVTDICGMLGQIFKADPAIGNDKKLNSKIVLFDENMMSTLMGFPNLTWLSVEVPAVYTSSMMSQDGVSYYVDVTHQYGVPSDVCPMPAAELGVALADDFPLIGCCAVQCNTTCDGSLMGNGIEARSFKIPTFQLAVPIRHRQESVQEYAAEEVVNAIHFIEEQTGEKFDWDAFFKSMKRFNAETEEFLEWMEISKTDYPQVMGVTLALYRYGVYQAAGGRNQAFLDMDKKLTKMALDDVVEEGKSPALSAQRSFADAGKMGILIELHTVEHGNHTQVLHVTVLHDGIEDDLPVGIHILQLLPGDVLQEGGNREDGTGTEPAAHVVAADMIEHRIVGDVEDVILQLLETADAHDFLVGFRIAEDEIAEAHVLLHQATEIYTHLLGVLIYKAESLGFCLGTVVALGTLDDERHERIGLADVTEETQSGIRTFLTSEGIGAVLGIRLLLHLVAESLGGTLQREPGIADDTQGVVGILIVEFLRLFVGTGEYHLRTATHSHRGSMAVEGFLGKILALLEDIVVEVGQDGTVEAHGVFYQEYHLHACLPDIVLQVHLILNELDDGEDEVGVAQPAEYVIEDAEVFVLHSLGDAVGERGEYHAVDIRELALDITRHIEGIVVGIARHTDDEVDDGGAQHLGCLFGGGHLGKGWGVTESQLHILIIYLLLDASIIF